MINNDQEYLQQTKKAYYLAFGALFILVSITQALVQLSINQQATFSNRINISGRQRMLSQRIVNLSNRYFKDKNTVLSSNLKESINEFKLNHIALRDGDKKRKLTEPLNKDLLKAYYSLDHQINLIVNSAVCVLESCQNSRDSLNQLNSNSDIFLNKMNGIVLLSTQFSEQKMKRLATIEYIAYFLIISVMFILINNLLIPFNKRMIEIFKQRQAEKEKQSKLYHLSELGEINSEILHEVNNYLSVAHGNASMIKLVLEGHNVTDKEKAFADKLIDSIDKINNIGKGMRSLSKINLTGRFLITEIESELHGLIGPTLVKNNIKLVFKDNIESKILSNKAQILQILFNLMKCSIKNLDQDSDKNIEINFTREQGLVAVTISDNGQNFDNKNEDETTTLGINLSKKIAQALGGDLIYINHNELNIYKLTFEDQSLTTSDQLKVAS